MFINTFAFLVPHPIPCDFYKNRKFNLELKFIFLGFRVQQDI